MHAALVLSASEPNTQQRTRDSKLEAVELVSVSVQIRLFCQ